MKMKLDNPTKILRNKDISNLMECAQSTADKIAKDIKEHFKTPKITVFHYKKYFSID